MAQGTLNAVQTLRATIGFDVYTKPEVDALLDEKADKTDTYTKAETNSLLDDKADKSTTYTKTEVDNALSLKANSADVYTKTEADNLLSNKADKSTTLAGYGITDAYTKTQTDTLLNGKADADSVYTKQEIDTKIPSSVGSATKPVYVNGGVVSACTHELNKTVPANAVFTDTTYTAGNGLNLSGTSFSAKAGTNVTVDGNGINVNGNGVVASADSGLINGGTAYTELRPTLDGTWVKNAQTTATNLQKLEGGIEYLYGLLSHQYDQLKKYINGNYYDYDTDTDSKYTKTVPQGAMPYASLDSIGGKTLVWNQILKNGNFVDSTGWTAVNCSLSVADNVATITYDGSKATVYIASGTVTESFNLSHKYYICGDFTVSGSGVSAQVFMYGIGITIDSVNFPATESANFIHQARISNGNSGTDYRFRIQINTNSVAGTVQVKNAFICDLTLCYGAGNEPSTVEEFTAQFPAQYYPYNAGTLLSAGVTEVVSKGKNLVKVYPASEWTNFNTAIVSVAENEIKLSATGTSSSWAVNNQKINAKAGDVFSISCTTDKLANVRLMVFMFDKEDNKLTVSATGWTWNAYYKGIFKDNDSGTVTIPNNNDIQYIKVGFLNHGGAGDVMTLSNIQVEESATATSYSPYHAPIITPIPASIQALEGYGWSAGSVYNYIDYERKVFVKNVGMYTFTGNESFTAWGQAYYATVLNSTNSGVSTTNKNITSNRFIGEKANLIYTHGDSELSVGVNSTRIYLSSLAYNGNYAGAVVYYELATPIETDISAYLTDDNIIEVEAGGTLTFENQNGDDYRIDVPSSETYMVDLQSAI